MYKYHDKKTLSILIIAALILQISSPLIAMDEKPKTQAELDAIQFAREQESKKLSAAANKQGKEQQRKRIEDGLKVALKDARIKDKPFNADLIEVLPADVQKEIVKFAYSPTAISRGYQLLPALIPHCPLDFFSPPQSRYKSGKKYKKSFSVDINRRFIFRRIDRLLTCEYERTIRGVNSENGERPILNQRHDYLLNFFTRWSVPYENFKASLVNDVLYLSKGPVRDMVENCSMEQLDLIRSLWTSHIDKCKRARGAGNRPIFAINVSEPIKLSAQETKVFESLPKQMQASLKTNYCIQLDRTRYAKVALVGLGCAALIGAVWKFRK